MKMFSLVALLLALCLPACAQLNSLKDPNQPTPSSSGLSSDKPQIPGCLTKDASGNGFSLTSDKFPDGVPVISKKDLAGQVGHEVLLTGVWKKVPVNTAAGNPGGKEKIFDASRIDRLADNCKRRVKAPDDVHTTLDH